MLMIDFSRNHFQLFGLPERFRLEPATLDRAYQTLQSEVHPDRYATADATEQRLALQASARANEAYRALKDPVTRAQYLLSLHGVNAVDETDTRLPLDFLERQLERREAASDAAENGDIAGLERVLEQVHEEARALEAGVAALLDEKAWDRARGPVRELRFVTKVVADIDAMLAMVEE
jgi:molecular chaperone HscB